MKINIEIDEDTAYRALMNDDYNDYDGLTEEAYLILVNVIDAIETKLFRIAKKEMKI